MLYDDFLNLRQSQEFDPPRYSIGCVGCTDAYAPDDLKLIEDLCDEDFEFLTKVYGDEPEQCICLDCLKEAQRERARLSA